MTTKRRGLAKGRGLEALLGVIQQEKTTLSGTIPQDGQLQNVAVAQLQRGKYQPRQFIADESLSELAESVAKHGVMQPIVIRPLTQENVPPADNISDNISDGKSDGKSGSTTTDVDNSSIRYEIIAGERRWRAAKQAGLTEIPAIVRNISDQVAIALALIENIQRQDLNPMEQALALQRFHDEFAMSHQEIAETVGKARATVSNLLRLLALDESVKELLAQNQLDMGHARALLSLKKTEQAQIAHQVVQKGLSVRQTEQLVRDLSSTKTTTHKVENADIARLGERLTARFGAEVKIDHQAKGKGKIVIKYHSLEELDGILNACLPDSAAE